MPESTKETLKKRKSRLDEMIDAADPPARRQNTPKVDSSVRGHGSENRGRKRPVTANKGYRG